MFCDSAYYIEEPPPPLAEAASKQSALVGASTVNTDITETASTVDVSNDLYNRDSFFDFMDNYLDEEDLDDGEEEDEDEDEDEEEDEDEDTEEDEDEEEESVESDGGPDLTQREYVYHPSDDLFQSSDLEDRKNRRYLLGVHSFMDLNDPELDTALIPADPEAEKDLLSIEEKEKLKLREEKDYYKDICDKLGVQPDPRVLQSLRLPVMNLRNLGMNEKEITAVCKVLEKNSYVKMLILAGNCVGTNGGRALAEMIEKNTTLVGFDLTGTEILEVFDKICDALLTRPEIEYLNFSKNELEDVDMKHVRKLLKELNQLTSLILYANLIKDDGLKMIGQGLFVNKSLEVFDISSNKLQGDQKAANFYNACSQHPTLKVVNLRRNYISDDGGKQVARMLGNKRMEEVDASFNRFGDGSAQAFTRVLGWHNERPLKILQLEMQRWTQNHGAAILQPLQNAKIVTEDFELLDFGIVMDVHTKFLDAKQKVLKVRPNLKIIHGHTYGLEHAKGPDHKQLVIRKAYSVCESFETTLVMLMEELAKEKPVLTQAEFKKFLKQCNLFKDKTVTDAFMNVFSTPGDLPSQPNVDAEGIIAAFDKEYPGLRVIPEPEEEEEEMEEKPPKKKKGKGKGGKGGKDKDKGAKKGKKK